MKSLSILCFPAGLCAMLRFAAKCDCDSRVTLRINGVKSFFVVVKHIKASKFY